jgi:hypothetical protein
MALETFIAIAPEWDHLNSVGVLTNSWIKAKEGTGRVELSGVPNNPLVAALARANQVRQVFLSFDLSYIPADAIVVSATLDIEPDWVHHDTVGLASHMVGIYHSSWIPGGLTVSDWAKASVLVTKPHAFLALTSEFTAYQVSTLPIVNLDYLTTGATIGIVVAEIHHASDYAEPPYDVDGNGTGMGFYTLHASGRTPPTLTVNYKGGTGGAGGGGLMLGANF